MSELRYRNSLTNTPVIGKPKLGLRKRVYDADDYIIGSVSGSKILDLNGRVWGTIVKKDTAGYNKNDIVSHGTVIGTLDNQNNIYSKRRSTTTLDVLPSVFTGRIKSNKVAAVLLPLLISILALTVVSGAIVAGMLNPEDDYLKYAPVLSVSNQKDSVVWTQNTKLPIFYSNNYNTDKFIAPGDKGNFVFLIRNDNRHAIDYTITITEDHEDLEHKFALRYKLSCETFYVIGDGANFVEIVEVTTPVMRLEAGQTRAYTLHWWWDPDFSNEDDMFNSTNQTEYNINIAVQAEYAD